jgi:hypothetical protein
MLLLSDSIELLMIAEIVTGIVIDDQMAFYWNFFSCLKNRCIKYNFMIWV